MGPLGNRDPSFTFLLTAGMFLLTSGRGPRPVFALFALLTLVRPEGAAYFHPCRGAARRRAGEKPRKTAAEGLLIGRPAPRSLSRLEDLLFRRHSAQHILREDRRACGPAPERDRLHTAIRRLVRVAPRGSRILPPGRKGTGREGGSHDFGRLTVPLSVIGLNWILVTVLGGDWMLMYRLLVPGLPAIAVMAAASIPRAAALQRAGRRDLSWQSAALAVIFACVAMAPGSSGYRGFERERLAVRAFGWVGEILGDRLPPGTSLGCGSTGAIGFYSGLPIVDILGLTEPEIARNGKIVAEQPGHMKALGSHVLDRKPDLLLLGNIQVHRENGGRISEGSRSRKRISSSILGSATGTSLRTCHWVADSSCPATCVPARRHSRNRPDQPWTGWRATARI